MTNWPQHTKDLSSQIRTLRSGAPEVMKAFSAIAQAATAAKALDAKTKELIALGIAVAVRCDDCIGFHVKAALEYGASRDEVTETLGMAIYMGAGPAVMYASARAGSLRAVQVAGALARRHDRLAPARPGAKTPDFKRRIMVNRTLRFLDLSIPLNDFLEGNEGS